MSKPGLLETPQPPTPKVRVVVATREDRAGFLAGTATGRSLSLPHRPLHPVVEIYLQERNHEGLPAIYNRTIEASRTDPAVLVFLHDDFHLCDSYWAEQAVASLADFQLVGLAGNRRRLPNQPSWASIDAKQTRDRAENLSGMVGYGKGFPPVSAGFYGPSRQEVKLLDGLMLIVHSDTLIAHDLRFDERFDFHFYDMDICRQAEAKGLRMGTWPISVIHESSGAAGLASEGWKAGYRAYLEKWGD